MSTPIGPYSPVVVAGPWLITSGQLGLAPPAAAGAPGPVRSSPVLVEGGAPAQLAQALENGERLLAEHGATRHDVVKTTLYLTDMDLYVPVNDAYVAFFGDHRPARSAVGVASLPMGAAVEVELWAYLAP
jgi:2-iminobutanoate/2-iminopropanoate deaminase